MTYTYIMTVKSGATTMETVSITRADIAQAMADAVADVSARTRVPAAALRVSDAHESLEAGYRVIP